MTISMPTGRHSAAEQDDAVTAPIALPRQAVGSPRSGPQQVVRPAPAAAAPIAPAPAPAPAAAPRRRRRWPWVVLALFVVFVIAVSTNSAGPAAPVTTPTPAGGTAATPLGGSSGNAAPIAPTAPAFVPKTYSGKGDDVVTIDKPAAVAIMTFSCPKCSGNVIVQSDGAETLLVNTIGSYSGKRWIDASSGSTTSRLTIQAGGSWKVTIGGPDQARSAGGPVSGKGDDVIALSGDSTTAAITNKGQGNFIVQSVPTEGSLFGSDLAVNEIGSYTGTVPLETPTLVQVTSEGSWTITPKS